MAQFFSRTFFESTSSVRCHAIEFIQLWTQWAHYFPLSNIFTHFNCFVFAYIILRSPMCFLFHLFHCVIVESIRTGSIASHCWRLTFFPTKLRAKVQKFIFVLCSLHRIHSCLHALCLLLCELIQTKDLQIIARRWFIMVAHSRNPFESFLPLLLLATHTIRTGNHRN